MSFPNHVMVRRRVGRREPKPDIPFELVTCNGSFCLCGGGLKIRKTNVSSCSLHLRSVEGGLQPGVSTRNTQFCAGHLPKAFISVSIDAAPSNRSSSQRNINDESDIVCAPSITTLVLFTRPCTTSSVCATVNRTSSLFNRSSLCSVASTSLSPRSFFANFCIEY